MTESPLRRFFHDLAVPLSAVALHLEAATRRLAAGKDPTEPLATAKHELTRAFELFEKEREAMLEAETKGSD